MIRRNAGHNVRGADIATALTSHCRWFTSKEREAFMDERTLQFFMNQVPGPDPLIASRQIRAGKICSSCRVPLPQPHAPGRKQCEQCVGRHLVHMEFFRSFGWHCRFWEGRRRLPKRLTFRDSAKIYETAERGNARNDKAAREALDTAILIGRGGVGLRLTGEQYRALGGFE